MLKAYLISVAISIVVSAITVAAINKRATRDGIVINKTSQIEKIYSYLICIVPVINILISFVFIVASEKIYAKIKEKQAAMK